MSGQRHQRRQDAWVGTRKVSCRAATALRMTAQSLHHSKSALGDFYRRMRAKLGAPKAITAAAHQLARIIFHLITSLQEFDESRFAADQLLHRSVKKSNSGRRQKPWQKPWVSNLFLSNRPDEFLRAAQLQQSLAISHVSLRTVRFRLP